MLYFVALIGIEYKLDQQSCCLPPCIEHFVPKSLCCICMPGKTFGRRFFIQPATLIYTVLKIFNVIIWIKIDLNLTWGTSWLVDTWCGASGVQSFLTDTIFYLLQYFHNIVIQHLYVGHGARNGEIISQRWNGKVSPRGELDICAAGIIARRQHKLGH